MSEPQTVGEFLTRVCEIRDAWFQPDDGWGPWFRGHTESGWSLLPKLYRDYGGYAKVKKNKLEDEIREEFIKRAPIMCESLPAGGEVREEWEWYFMMQHFGAPTRLLDWTEGALIALYFAVKDNSGTSDAAVWVLEPFKLNKSVIGREWIIPPSAAGVKNEDRELVEPWLPTRFTGMRGLPRRTVAIEPTHVARRISAQHSCFTVHGSDESALDKLEGSGRTACLIKITIPRFKVRHFKKELRSCGINESTIFPDLVGLAASISARWDPIPGRKVRKTK